MFGLGVVAADTLDGTGVVDVPSLGVKSAFGLAVIDVVGDRLVGTAVSSKRCSSGRSCAGIKRCSSGRSCAGKTPLKLPIFTSVHL